MAKLKTIAIVVNSSWNIVNFRLGLVRNLVGNAYKVIAIAPKDYDTSMIESSGATFVPLQRLSRKGINPIEDLGLVFEFKRIFKDHKVDLVMNFTIKPVIYGSLASGRIPVINTMTGLGYSFIRKGIINRIAKTLYRIALRNANFVVFQNEDDQAEFLNLKLITATKAKIIPGSGINSDYFAYQNVPPRQDKLKVLFVGRMLIDKGITELLKAFVQLNKDDYELHLVGAIDHQNPAAITKEKFQKHTALENIFYHGKVEDTRPFYQEAHVVILPSYREGLPRAILEAMSTGRPILVTDVPGCRQTVENDKNGHLLTVKSSDSIVEKLQTIHELSHYEISSMGLYGRKMVEEKFEEKRIVEHYSKLIEEIELS